jgi:hypothetical protein
LKEITMIAVLVTVALLQDQPLVDNEKGERIQVDDRLELTMKTGGTLRGIVIKPRGAPEGYDPSMARLIHLNLKFDHLRLNGTVAVERQHIKTARKLPPLSPDRRAAILKAKAIAMAELDDEEKARMKRQDEQYSRWLTKRLTGGGGGESETSEKSDEEKKREEEALRIYARYPEDKGWGPEKYAELKKVLIPTNVDDPKYLDVRKSIPRPGGGGTTYAAADKDESEFFDKFDLWKLGKSLFEAAESEEGEESKAETPKPADDVNAAVKAYLSYRAAVESGHVPTVIKTLTAKNRESVEADPNAHKTLAKIAQTQPKEINIVSKSIQGNTATITAIGKLANREVQGTITLQKEDGSWKVNSVSWE